MDRIAEWRPVDPAGPDGPAEPDPADEPRDGSPVEVARPNANGWKVFAPAVALLTAAGLAMATAIGLLIFASLPSPKVGIDSASGSLPPPSGIGGVTDAASQAPGALAVVVDVEGAVENPGVWQLPAGSRIADAIAAAGGYSAQVDIDAASHKLNLAEPIVDGQQIHVPLRGEAMAGATDGGGDPTKSPGGGLINVNAASEGELDTLPGIGPVTAAKIVAAREETPFGSIDELQQRGVISQSVLDKIRSLITVAR